MAIVRHDPAEGTRLFDPLDRGLFDWPLRSMEMWRHLLQDDDMIKVEEYMDGNELVVRAELAGVDPERDVQVSITDGALTIRAERRQDSSSEDRRMRRAEIRYGSFSRTLPLPPGAKESDITARYKDGVLEVRAPLHESASKTSAVPIQRA
jgi:HSP20 family protein